MAKKKIESPKEKVITPALLESIDELGRVRAQRLSLEKREDELSKLIKEGIPADKIVYATQFGAKIIIPPVTKVDARAVRKLLGEKHFMDVANVTLTALKKTTLSPEQVEKVTISSEGSPRIVVFPAVPGIGEVGNSIVDESIIRTTM